MKKTLLLLILCSALMTGCSHKAEMEKPVETMTISQTTTAVQDSEPKTTTTITTSGITDVTEECSEVTPTVTTETEATTSTETIMSDVQSTTTSVKNEESTETQTTSVATNKVTTTTKVKTEPTITTCISTTTKPVVTTKVTTTTKKSTTTVKPVTTTKTTTTTTKPVTTTSKITTTKPKTTTTVTTTSSKRPVVTDRNLYAYWHNVSDRMDDKLLDWLKITDQVGVFLDTGEIDYVGLYEIGKTFKGSEYERIKAVTEYAYNLGGVNCIEYALNAYFLAWGADLEFYLARSSKYDWYGHVANIAKIDGEYYYIEPQGNIVGSPYTFAAGGNGISYPNGLDVVTDIYEKPVSVVIADHWYE